MDEAKVLKSNLCRIFLLQSDGGKSVFGCGCLVKCGDQSLKIATSRKIRKSTDGEVFATFETLPDKKVILQIDREEEGEDRGIAYVSFDEAAFRHRPEGILMGDIRGIEEIAYRVPVLENLELLGTPTSEIRLYDVERDHTRCTLKIQAGSKNRVINNLRESDKFHLLVRGAPILGADNFQFLGIVDFVEMGEESWLELVYHGFQRTPRVSRNQPTMHPVTPTHEKGSQIPTAEAVVNIKCTFCGPSNPSASANLASKYGGNKLKELKDVVQEAVLPVGAYVRNVVFGSATNTFIIMVTELKALEKIWERFKEGTEMKQNFADKIFKISPQDQPGLDLTIEISEDEYTKAKEQLIVPPNPANDIVGDQPRIPLPEVGPSSETVSTPELSPQTINSMGEDIKSNIRTSADGSPTPGRSQDNQQETTDDDRNCLSPDDPLGRLWDYIDFQDTFSNVLNVKYAHTKYWPHLAEQFGISRTTYDAFSTSDINSPTETLFEYLGATQPTYSVKEFREDCKEADAHEVFRLVEKSVKAGDLSEGDLVTKMCNKVPKVLDTITLKLDREDRLWINLARKRGISEETYSSFKSDRTENPTRLLFDVLAAEGPDLNIKNFKDKLIKLNKNDLVQFLNEFKFSDEMPLRDLSKHPDAISEIESNLNNLKTDYLWKLARLYQQEDSLMEDVDIARRFRFRQKEHSHSPTHRMMDYVLASLPKQYTIQDLIIKLKTIKRNDCLSIIAPYLKGGKDDIDKITKGLENLRVDQCEGRKGPSTGDDSTSSFPASDEPVNQFVLD